MILFDVLTAKYAYTLATHMTDKTIRNIEKQICVEVSGDFPLIKIKDQSLYNYI